MLNIVLDDLLHAKKCTKSTLARLFMVYEGHRNRGFVVNNQPNMETDYQPTIRISYTWQWLIQLESSSDVSDHYEEHSTP